MGKSLQAATLIAATWATPTLAGHGEPYPAPYLGSGAELLVTDGTRRSEEGVGFYLSYGIPIDDQGRAIELRFLDVGYERPDGKNNYQSALFIDYVHALGILGRSEDAPFAYVRPFAIAGVGFVEEDVDSQKHMHFGFALGVGAIAPLGFNGWALRLDARAQPQVNNESITAEDYLLDYVVNLGVQIPLPFYDRPLTVPPAADCAVKVVNLDTGRADCVTDSDGDGVYDSDDTCPGTASGAAVDERGCARATHAVPLDNDGDQDGVRNARDQCPDTQPGLEVDDEGCVVAQNTSIDGVSFEVRSAKLTAHGGATLHGVAQTLSQQSYNTLLLQQRAE